MGYFGDLVLIFEITMELNRSNLSVCGVDHSFFLKNNASSLLSLTNGTYM